MLKLERLHIYIHMKYEESLPDKLSALVRSVLLHKISKSPLVESTGQWDDKESKNSLCVVICQGIIMNQTQRQYMYWDYSNNMSQPVKG
jgi:hypothetical protein